ncbi:MAG: hypothetical protein V4671_06175 [Armatimonadota bacterium]
MPGLPTTTGVFVGYHVKWNNTVKGLSDILANVCADCGHVELVAANPKKVWEEWQKHNA